MTVNRDLQDIPQTINSRFDVDMQSRRFGTMLAELYEMKSGLRDLLAGAVPTHVTAAGGEATYATQTANLRDALTAAVNAIKAIDAIS